MFPDLYVINKWFKFEDKISNNLKIITFTRNHSDNDRTKNDISPSRGGGGMISSKNALDSKPPVIFQSLPCAFNYSFTCMHRFLRL